MIREIMIMLGMALLKLLLSLAFLWLAIQVMPPIKVVVQ